MPQKPVRETRPVGQTTIALGTWSAILATTFTVAFVVLALAFSPREWTGIAAYAEDFTFLQMANFIPVILLAPTVVVLMVCIHRVAPEARRVLSLIGIAFSSVYAAIICTNYYVQLFVVRLNLIHGDLDGLTLLAMPNLRSVFFALETVGYAFLSLATMFISPIFSGGRLEGWIRWLLIGSGALGIFGVVVAPFDRPMLIFAGLGIWSLAFPVATALMSVFFRRRRAAGFQRGTLSQDG